MFVGDTEICLFILICPVINYIPFDFKDELRDTHDFISCKSITYFSIIYFNLKQVLPLSLRFHVWSPDIKSSIASFLFIVLYCRNCKLSLRLIKLFSLSLSLSLSL